MATLLENICYSSIRNDFYFMKKMFIQMFKTMLIVMYYYKYNIF